jgi:hypothetical protein
MKPSRAELVAALERALHTEQPVTRRPSPLSAEERLQQAVEEIERVRAELRLEAPPGRD